MGSRLGVTLRHVTSLALLHAESPTRPLEEELERYSGCWLWLALRTILGTSVRLWVLAVTAQLALLSMVARVSAGPPVWLHVSLLALLSGCSCVLRLASRLALLHVWHCGLVWLASGCSVRLLCLPVVGWLLCHL